MKLKSILLVPIVLLLVVFFACDMAGGSGTDESDDSEDPAPTAPTTPSDPAPTVDSYYVSFKLDGQTYIFSNGFTLSVDSTALNGDACAIFESGRGVYVAGASQSFNPLGSDDSSAVEHAILGIPMDPPAAGTYAPGMVSIMIAGAEYTMLEDEELEAPVDFQIVVTAAGAVGGVVEGTFSGTVGLDADDDDVFETTKSVTDGYFRVYRAADVHYDDGKLTVNLENSPNGILVRVELYAEDDETEEEYLVAACEAEGTGGTLALILKTVDGRGIPTTQDWIGTGGTEYEIEIFIDEDGSGTFTDLGTDYGLALTDEDERDYVDINGDVEETFDFLEDFALVED